jgi:hypothetical protein
VLVKEGPPLVFLTSVLLVCVWCWSLDYAAPSSHVFALSFKKWCCGDRNRASLVPVARQLLVVTSTMEVLAVLHRVSSVLRCQMPALG